MWIVIVILLLVILFFLLKFMSPGNARRGGIVEFYLNGMDAGFSFAEIKLLWMATGIAELDKPSSVFGSMEELARIINHISRQKDVAPTSTKNNESLLLEKLLKYRNKMELTRAKNRSGMKSTRTIAVGQFLAIRVDGGGMYKSQVIANDLSYLTISIPVGEPLPGHFSWRASVLNVYFWRQDDAGYFFQSNVISNYHELSNLNFRINHSDIVIRRQRRESIRRQVSIQASMWKLRNIDEANQFVEAKAKLPCVVESLSTGGVLVKTQNRIRERQIIRLEFEVQNEQVVVSGLAIRCQYDDVNAEFQLNVEFLSYGQDYSMIILWYVLSSIDKKDVADFPDGVDSTGAMEGAPLVGEASSDAAGRTGAAEADLLSEVEELDDVEEVDAVEELDEL